MLSNQIYIAIHTYEANKNINGGLAYSADELQFMVSVNFLANPNSVALFTASPLCKRQWCIGLMLRRWKFSEFAASLIAWCQGAIVRLSSTASMSRLAGKAGCQNTKKELSELHAATSTTKPSGFVAGLRLPASVSLRSLSPVSKGAVVIRQRHEFWCSANKYVNADNETRRAFRDTRYARFCHEKPAVLHCRLRWRQPSKQSHYDMIKLCNQNWRNKKL